MTTKQTAICNALVTLGYKETDYPTKKYRVFKRKDGQFYFVGKGGGLRFGRTIDESIPSGMAQTIIKSARKATK